MIVKEVKNIKSEKIDYSTFIKQDKDVLKQKTLLINLYYLTRHYKSKGIQSNKSADKRDYTKYISPDDRRTLHLLKLAVLDNRPFDLNISIDLSYSKMLYFILVMAMTKSRMDVLELFLECGFPKSINCSIFNHEISPTFFQLACCMNLRVLFLFEKYYPLYNLAWNGLTPQILCLNKEHSFYDKQEWSFLTTYQYELITEFKNIYIRKNKDSPIFLIDFYCMTSHVNNLSKILKNTPELINVTKYSFVLSHQFEIVRILIKYSIGFNQTYGQLSPLHMAVYANDINLLTTYLYTHMNCNLQDEKGNTPMHLSAKLKRYFLLELLIRCGGNVEIRNQDGESVRDIYEKDNWVMKKPNYKENEVVLNIADMDQNNEDFECSSIALDHIANIRNFKTKSRFKIFSLVNFYNAENDALYKIKLLEKSRRFICKIYKESDRIFEKMVIDN